jgi:hypothetical protein
MRDTKPARRKSMASFRTRWAAAAEQVDQLSEVGQFKLAKSCRRGKMSVPRVVEAAVCVVRRWTGNCLFLRP